MPTPAEVAVSTFDCPQCKRPKGAKCVTASGTTVAPHARRFGRGEGWLARDAQVPAAPTPPQPTTTGEEFTGPAGTLPASMVRVGKEAGSYGIEAFAADPDLVGLDGNGNLRVSAIKRDNGQWAGGFTKFAKQITLDRKTSIKYRFRFPTTKGGFPAIWLANDIDGTLGPMVAEIDTELFPGGGWQGNGLYFTVHNWKPNPQQGINLPPKLLTDDWHEGEIIATPEPTPSLEFKLDGVSLGVIDRSKVTDWVFDDKPMWLLINQAVSGKWSGATVPDAGTTRIDMLVDYVRVTQ